MTNSCKFMAKILFLLTIHSHIQKIGNKFISQKKVIFPKLKILNCNICLFCVTADADKKRKRHYKGSLFKKSSVADAKKKELMQDDCIQLATYLKGIMVVRDAHLRCSI